MTVTYPSARAVTRIAAAAIVLGGIAWLALHLPYTAKSPLVPCTSVISGSPVIVTVGRQVGLAMTLHVAHPPAVAVVQILDGNGFGWLARKVPQSSRWHIDLPQDRYRVRTIRLGLLSVSEAERASIARRAAREFDVSTWVEQRGWDAPHMAVCATLETDG